MVQGRTLWELMERRVDTTPDALVAVDEDMSTLTFAELWAEAELAAAGFAAEGLGERDVVAWQLPNWIETLVVVAALSRLGVVQLPIDPSLAPHDVERLVGLAAADLLVVPSWFEGRDLEAEATEIARRDGSMRVLVTERALPQGDPTALPPLPEELDADEQPVRWLFHTPGTTAEPTLVQHTDATIAAAARGIVQRLGLIPQDRNAVTLPTSRVEGMAWFVASIQAGCSNILAGSTDPDECCEVFGREGVTLAVGSPQDHDAFVRHQRSQLHPAFPDLRAFPSVGGPSEPGRAAEVRALFDVPVLPAYGSTEAPVLTMASISDPDHDLDRGEGTALPGVEIRLVQQDGTIATGGVEGEMRVRAPQLMLGYLDQALHARAFDDDGFFRTGDVARIDERGVVAVTGRAADVTVRPLDGSKG